MYKTIRTLFLAGLLFGLTLLSVIFAENVCKAEDSTEVLISTDEQTDTEEIIDDDDELLQDIDAGTVYAWELTGQTIQNTLSGPNTQYWRGNNSFLVAQDSYGRVVPAYCMQPRKASPNQNVKLVEGNSVLSPDGLQAAACIIAAFGYGGLGADPNAELFGAETNYEAGGSYASFVINGELKRGMMINGKIYELTSSEARAVTGAAIHYFSALAGQGYTVDAPTGSKVNEAHNNTVINVFNELVFLGKYFMNNYGSLEKVSNSLKNGTEWERKLDDYSINYTWQIKTKDGSYVSFNPNTDNNITNERYIINNNGEENIVIKIRLQAAKCSLKLIPQSYVVKNSNKGIVLTNNNKISIPDRESGVYNYFYVSADNTCSIEYGPLYNGTISQQGYNSIMNIPSFNQDVTITIPLESAVNGISLEGHTLTCLSPTPIYGDGNHDGIYNYSCRLFSDKGGSKDYQDVLFFSSANTFKKDTSSRLSASFKHYGSLEIFKASSNTVLTDNNSNYSLNGAVYRVYGSSSDALSNNNYIYSMTTDSNGYACLNNIETGTYYLKEYSAPLGYKTDDEIHTFVIEEGSSVSEVTTTRVYLNESPEISPVDIAIYKTDENGKPLGDAEFTVRFYNVMSETNPADSGMIPIKTWVLLTEPDTGIAHFSDKDKIAGDDFYYNDGNAVLPLGTITIEETRAPEGYEKNDYIDVQMINIEKSSNTIVKYNPPSISDKQIRQAVEFIKLGENKADTYTPLNNAGFMACPVSELKKDKNGNYIWDNDKAIILTNTGEKELFTNTDGYAKTIPLEYGSYVFKETTVPINYLPIKDFVVNISSSSPETKQLGTFYDKGFKIYLKIVKACEFSGLNIINNPAVFSIWSYDENRYVDFDGITELTTDENGELTTPLPLFAGKYRIDEIKSPNGYKTACDSGTDFEISENSIYEIKPDDTSLGTMEVIIYNKPLSGELIIEKSGEILVKGTSDTVFSQSFIPLSDATFGIYAYENIYAMDGHDSIIYKKDELVAEISTDTNGNANISNLPYGKYIIRELVTPPNYVPADDIIFNINEETHTEKIINYLVKSKINLNKKSSDFTQPVEGAYYALYEYDSSLKSADEYRKKAFLEEKATDSEGNICFDTELPPGSYVVIETKAPDGYYISEDIELIETSNNSSDTKVLSANTYENASIVSSAYSDSEASYNAKYNYYSLSVSDKKIPENPDNPKTGDILKSIMLAFIISGLSILTIILITKKKRSK